MFDCIAAISTPVGVGGIAIVRVSGKDTVAVVSKIFKQKDFKDIQSHSITYGNIEHNGKIIDECLIMYMKAPKTYTKEDVIEINCHGGIKSAQNILEVLLNSGARLAENGEFTKRAFLNGRIDLSQAEAVIDIINAKTNISLQSALNQLDGSLSATIKKYRNSILSLIANIEAAIDYPENDIEELTMEKIGTRTIDLIEEIKKLIESFEMGKIVREGIETVILGKPNVGKSSLLNLLIKEDRAIVTDIAGTTRDVLQEYINIHNIPIKILDTAGIRETSNPIEKIGVDKSKQYALKADLILLILDGSLELSKEDIEILELVKDKKLITIINKSDLEAKLDKNKILEYLSNEDILEISVKERTGVEKIYNRLKDMFFKGEINLDNEGLLTNIRHKDLLLNAVKSLENVISSLNERMSVDFISIDLQQAYAYLGEITGEIIDEDIVDKIFSEFCLGK